MYYGQGVYCGPSTVSEVFLIFTTKQYQSFSVFLLLELVSYEHEVFHPKYSQCVGVGVGVYACVRACVHVCVRVRVCVCVCVSPICNTVPKECVMIDVIIT